MMPRKLSAVVVCVGRAEHLRQTLAHNAGQVDELIVVSVCEEDGIKSTTRVEDLIQMGHTKNVRFVLSDRCFDRDFAFNKGAMLNDGLKALAPDADWVVLTDADCFLPDNLREYVQTHALNPGVLYGAVRGYATKDVAGNMGPVVPLAGAINAEPNGYFQLFNRRASAIRDRWPAVMSEDFCSAGGIDSWFMQQFPVGKRHVIPELAVRHIDHGKELGAGWNGTATGPRWRQVGMGTVDGIVRVGNPIETSKRYRLTDTLHGKSVEVDMTDRGHFPMDVIQMHSGGLAFCGEDIGRHHVHIAVWG